VFDEAREKRDSSLRSESRKWDCVSGKQAAGEILRSLRSE
jgi:hypothetical protein